MLTQNINIIPIDPSNDEIVPSYKYVCKLLKYGRDFNENIRRSWCAVRKYNVINNTAYDSDIYLIQKELLNKVQWPVASDLVNGYSSSPVDYNGVWDLQDYDIYDVYVKSVNDKITEGKAPCDILRIYHPVSKKKLNAIVAVSTVCGTIKVHLLCQFFNDGKTNSTESFDDGNDRYSEYQEFLLPSIDWLTAGGNAWIIEDIANVDENTDTNDLVVVDGETDYVDLAALKVPFKTTSEDVPGEVTKIFNKIYLPEMQEGLKEDYVSLPIKITIWPYVGHDETTSQTMWMPSEVYSSGVCVLQDDATISIAASFGFDNGYPSIISNITWPKTYNVNTLEEAYKYFYGVDLSEYEYEESDTEEDPEEDDEKEPEKKCHFDIKIFSDYSLKNEIWHSYVDIDKPDDFSFQLAGIFTDWRQFPDIVVIQTRFVDRWLGNIIKSNPVFLSNNQLKYLVSEWPNSSRINIEGQQAKITKKEDMDLTNINFIDKVTCVIKKTAPEKQVISTQQKNNTKILYKPVFYRTRDLYNLQLHEGVTQNVGVNLVEYMTKVESFVLTIGELRFNEIARNDTFVIFRIDAAVIKGNSGKYYISDQDGEFISAGNFYIS